MLETHTKLKKDKYTRNWRELSINLLTELPEEARKAMKRKQCNKKGLPFKIPV